MLLLMNVMIFYKSLKQMSLSQQAQPTSCYLFDVAFSVIPLQFRPANSFFFLQLDLHLVVE